MASFILFTSTSFVTAIRVISLGSLPTCLAALSIRSLTIAKFLGMIDAIMHLWFTPLEKPTGSCRWYKSLLRDGGSMPPSLIVREHSSLTGFTDNSSLFQRFFYFFHGKT